MSRHREQSESAARYYRSLHIPELLEEALNTGYRLQPPDLPAYLSNFFADLSRPPVISDIQARKVLGGAGSAALEVDVFCTVRNNDKKVASLVMSADSAPLIGGSGEGEESGTRLVEAAIDWIRTSIGPMLGGLQPSEQRSIDQILSDFFQPKFEEEKQRRERNATPSITGSAPSPPTSPAPSKKRGSGKGKKAVVAEKPVAPPDPPEPVVPGSLALSAVSLAVASGSAVLRDVPLYSYISTLKHGEPPGMMSIPIPLITLMSCGKSSPGKLNLLKEVMMIPRPEMSVQQAVALAASLQAQLMKSAPSCIKCVSPLGSLLFAGDRIDQPLDLMQEVCASLGADVYLAVNCAAQELMDSNKGKYEIASGVWKTPEDMLDVYAEVLSRHPAVIALVDPLRKEDVAQWAALQKAVGSRCYLLAEETCGDNVPSSGRVLHYTNQLTISDLLTSVHKLQGENQVTVLGCLQEESSGSSEVDLAVALGMQFVKLGGLLRGERTMKYNRLLAIEAELTHRGMLGSSSAFHFPVICSENSEEPEASP